MSAPEDGQDIEIYYGLHGGPPVLIGAGSWEDLGEAIVEAEQVTAETGFGPVNQARSGTEAFYRHMGRTAGVSRDTEAALAHYRSLVDGSREALRKLFTEGDLSNEAEK